MVYIAGLNGQPLAATVARGDLDTTHTPFSDGSTITWINRIVLSIEAANGDILVFEETRPAAQDYQSRGILMKRSTDGGKTYGEGKLIFYRTDYASNSKWVNLGAIGKALDGRLVLLFVYSDGASGSQVTTLKKIDSTDNGLTWSSQTTPTDITTGLKKVNNSSPVGLPACYNLSNAAWGWYMFGPGTILTEEDGRMICACNHRYTADQTGDSFNHCVISTDGGVTWTLGGGYQESTTTNEATNECEIKKLSTGNYYVNARVVSNGVLSEYSRAHAVITAAQLTGTWPTASAMTSNGSTACPVNSCAGSTIVDRNNGHVYVICPSNGSSRSNLRVYRSTDNGVTFPQYRVLFYGYAGYSTVIQKANGTFVVNFEATMDWDNGGNTDAFAASEYTIQRQFDQTWFENPTTYPATATYYLNDFPAGEASKTICNNFASWEGFTPPAKGGAGVTWDAVGLAFSGAGAGALIAPSLTGGSTGNIVDPGLDGKISYEFVLEHTTDPTNVALLDNRNNSGRGVTIAFDGFGLLYASFCDGTSTCTAFQGVPIVHAGGGPYYDSILVTYERGVGAAIYWGEDAGLLDTTADNLSATQGIVGSQVARLGSYANGTTARLPSGTKIHAFKITRDVARTSLSIEYPVTKPSVATLNGYAGVPLETIPALPKHSNLRLALFAPFLGGPGAFGGQDRYGGSAHYPYRDPALGPADGTGVGTYYDNSSLNKLWRSYSAGRGTHWDTDTQFGKHVRLSAAATQSTVDMWQPGPAAVTADYDFMQNTQVFSFLFCFNLVSDKYTLNATIFDMINSSGGNAGLNVSITTGTRLVNCHLGTGVNGSSVNRINESMSGAITLNNWYFCAIVGNGPSAKYHFYKSLYTAGVPATVTKVDSVANGTAGTVSNYTSTQIPTIGGRANANNGANIRLGPMLLFNASLSPAEVAQWAAVMNTLPPAPPAGIAGGGGAMFPALGFASPEAFILGQ